MKGKDSCAIAGARWSITVRRVALLAGKILNMRVSIKRRRTYLAEAVSQLHAKQPDSLASTVSTWSVTRHFEWYNTRTHSKLPVVVVYSLIQDNVWHTLLSHGPLIRVRPRCGSHGNNCVTSVRGKSSCWENGVQWRTSFVYLFWLRCRRLRLAWARRGRIAEAQSIELAVMVA